MLTDNDKRMTAKEAAVFLDLTAGRIRQMAVDGTLEYEKFGPILTFRLDDVASLRARMLERTGERRGRKRQIHKG